MSGTEYVHCLGASASLSLFGSSPDKPFVVRGLGPGASSWSPGDRPAHDGKEIDEEFTLDAGRFAESPFRMLGVSLPEIASGESYSILSANWLDHPGERVLEVRYRSNYDAPERPPLTGRVELLPDRGWAQRYHEYSTTARAGRGSNAPNLETIRVAMTVEYGDDIDGIPVPARVVFFHSRTGEERFEFTSFRLGEATPQRQFSLGYYGLPDITATPRDTSRSRIPYLLFGLAGADHAHAASSLHPGGLNVLMGDGSARFIRDTISTWPFDPTTGRPVDVRFYADGLWEGDLKPGVWQKLATRGGGELIEGDSY